MPVAIVPDSTEADIILRDGTTVRLRGARADDAAGVVTLFGELSNRSLYNRFRGVRHVDLAEARCLAALDRGENAAILAERGSTLCGIAGYYRDPQNPERAEVAFAVADAMQGRGLGTRMLERLAEIGRDRGVRAFDAYVLGDNLAMMDVFLQSGFALTSGLEQGVFHISLDL
jgi:RimJ/RimL family protein N-acetyltransferase